VAPSRRSPHYLSSSSAELVELCGTELSIEHLSGHTDREMLEHFQESATCAGYVAGVAAVCGGQELLRRVGGRSGRTDHRGAEPREPVLSASATK
jgi:hypothetical protein